MYMFYQHVVTMNPSACDSGNLEAAIELGAYAGLQLAWVPVWSAVLGFVSRTWPQGLGSLQGRTSLSLSENITLGGVYDRLHLPRACSRRRGHSRGARRYPELKQTSQSNSLRLTKSVCLHGRVIGTAIALNLLLGLPLWMGSLFTAVLSMVLVFLHDSHSTLFEALIAVALCVTSMCAIGMMLFGGVDSGALLTGLIIPSAPPETALIVVGTIGYNVPQHLPRLSAAA